MEDIRRGYASRRSPAFRSADEERRRQVPRRPGPTWRPSLFAGPSRAGLETVPVLADRTLPTPYPPDKMICPAAQRPPGSSSHRTPSWRKEDSNPRCPPSRARCVIKTVLTDPRLCPRERNPGRGTEGPHPACSAEESVSPVPSMATGAKAGADVAIDIAECGESRGGGQLPGPNPGQRT